MKRRRRDRSKWWTGTLSSVPVGESFQLVPYWERPTCHARRTNLILDPGPSFGAGEHPSTIMALDLLERAMRSATDNVEAPTLLDVGTGTGVLGIAGIMLGSGLAVGLDIEGSAIYTTRRNLQLNGLGRSAWERANTLQLFIGEIGAVGASFDVVLANLAAPVLVRIRDDLRKATRRFLILSGIADALADKVTELYSESSLNLLEYRSIDGWNAFLFKSSRRA